MDVVDSLYIDFLPYCGKDPFTLFDHACLDKASLTDVIVKHHELVSFSRASLRDVEVSENSAALALLPELPEEKPSALDQLNRCLLLKRTDGAEQARQILGALDAEALPPGKILDYIRLCLHFTLYDKAIPWIKHKLAQGTAAHNQHYHWLKLCIGHSGDTDENRDFLHSNADKLKSLELYELVKLLLSKSSQGRVLLAELEPLERELEREKLELEPLEQKRERERNRIWEWSFEYAEECRELTLKLRQSLSSIMTSPQWQKIMSFLQFPMECQ